MKAHAIVVSKMKKKLKYWYEFFFSECVLCGHQRNYKYRHYTPKPKDPTKRYHFDQFVCRHHVR